MIQTNSGRDASGDAVFTLGEALMLAIVPVILLLIASPSLGNLFLAFVLFGLLVFLSMVCFSVDMAVYVAGSVNDPEPFGDIRDDHPIVHYLVLTLVLGICWWFGFIFVIGYPLWRHLTTPGPTGLPGRVSNLLDERGTPSKTTSSTGSTATATTSTASTGSTGSSGGIISSTDSSRSSGSASGASSSTGSDESTTGNGPSKYGQSTVGTTTDTTPEQSSPSASSGASAATSEPTVPADGTDGSEDAEESTTPEDLSGATKPAPSDGTGESAAPLPTESDTAEKIGADNHESSVERSTDDDATDDVAIWRESDRSEAAHNALAVQPDTDGGS